MTLCSSGSSVKPSSAAYAWVTWLDAQSWLGSVWAKFSWLGALIPPTLVTASAFCATEPVQPVYPGDATVVAAATNPVAFEAIITYIKQSALWWSWHNLCQCNASGTPGCIASLFTHSGNLALYYDWGANAVGYRIVPSTNGLTLWGLDVDVRTSGSYQIIWFNIPTTVNNFTTVTLAAGWNRVYFSAPLTLVLSNTYEFVIRKAASGGVMETYYQTSAPSTPTGLSSIAPRILPYDLSTDNSAGAVYFGVDPVICAASPAAYAPAAPAVPTTSLPDVPMPTCTTVGDLCNVIGPNILDISLLKQRIDLLQRRLLPFAWIPGTPLTGLTGTGYVAVTDALGCIVTLTTTPGGWGSTAETPRRLIPTAGSLQASDGTNYDDWRQIHYEHEVYVFDTSWATRINYNFRQGFVATLTPIYPEP